MLTVGSVQAAEAGILARPAQHQWIAATPAGRTEKGGGIDFRVVRPFSSFLRLGFFALLTAFLRLVPKLVRNDSQVRNFADRPFIARAFCDGDFTRFGIGNSAGHAVGFTSNVCLPS